MLPAPRALAPSPSPAILLLPYALSHATADTRALLERCIGNTLNTMELATWDKTLASIIIALNAHLPSHYAGQSCPPAPSSSRDF